MKRHNSKNYHFQSFQSARISTLLPNVLTLRGIILLNLREDVIKIPGFLYYSLHCSYQREQHAILDRTTDICLNLLKNMFDSKQTQVASALLTFDLSRTNLHKVMLFFEDRKYGIQCCR